MKNTDAISLSQFGKEMCSFLTEDSESLQKLENDRVFVFDEFCEKMLDFIIAKNIDAEQRALSSCDQEFLGDCLIPFRILLSTYRENNLNDVARGA